MFDEIVSKLKANKKTIVFTEGEDARILEAATRLKKDGIMDVLLCGDPEKIKAAAAKGGFDLTGMAFADPNNYPEIDAMVSEMVALRKGKMTEDEVRTALKKSNYFGTMLVKMGKADCLLGGATYSTADTVRPALQLIKTKPGNKIVSSCFIMVRPAASGENEVLAMADCAINIKPNEDELVEICKETVSCAKIFGVDPKVAFLAGRVISGSSAARTIRPSQSRSSWRADTSAYCGSRSWRSSAAWTPSAPSRPLCCAAARRWRCTATIRRSPGEAGSMPRP